MSESARQETMLRKPILMPPSMIDKVDKIARNRKVSFAEVVMEAVNAFDGDLSMEDEALLETLAETMIKTTQEVVEKLMRLKSDLMRPMPCWRLNNGCP
jgi:hypothetical protein